jgi:hypothetical protein
MHEPWNSIQEPDLVITFSYRNGMKIIKNRDGINREHLDLADIIEAIIPYQKDYLKPVIVKFIEKLKIYRLFS